MNHEAWVFAGVVAATTVPAWLAYLNGRRNRTDVIAINRAVNHRPEGSPTLVERVGIIETETAAHRLWEKHAFTTIATQVGCTLPPYPDHSEETNT